MIERSLIAIVLALFLGACTADKSTPPAGEKAYTMNGVLLSRDTEKNTVDIDNDDVPGVMPPMKMDYEVRGAKVETLPADGTRVTMTLHAQDGTHWVTDVRVR